MPNFQFNNASANLIPRAVFNAVFSSDKFNICHINVQSLCARKFTKFDELKMNFYNSKADIICMTETWLNSTISDSMIAIDGYELVRNDRNRQGGGICVYVKKGIFCRILRKSSLVDGVNSRHSTEFLLLDLTCGDERIFLGVYYNPPEIDCSELLFNQLEEFSVKFKSTFIIGDFNTDLRKRSGRSVRFSDVLSSLSHSCINNEPTFFHQTGCSLLDLFITDSPEQVIKFNQVSMPGISRHDLIFATLNFTTRIEPDGFWYRDYNNFERNDLYENFYRIGWNDYFANNNSDLLLDMLNERLEYLHNQYFPLKFSKPKNNPWFNHEIEKIYD